MQDLDGNVAEILFCIGKEYVAGQLALYVFAERRLPAAREQKGEQEHEDDRRAQRQNEFFYHGISSSLFNFLLDAGEINNI